MNLQGEALSGGRAGGPVATAALPAVRAYRCDGLSIHCVESHPLHGAALSVIAERCRSQVKREGAGVLGGRIGVSTLEVDDLGMIVIKPYRRGGLFGLCNKEWYLRTGGPTRAAEEFRLLSEVRALGVNAPEPLGWVSQGGVVYRAWLMMRELQGTRTIAEISRSDEERLADLIPSVVDQIARLIEHRVFHIDLHPGNAVVDQAGVVHLIDFDKAVRFRGSAEELRDRYLTRWRRAVIKHQLPEVLCELMAVGLRLSTGIR